LPLAYYYNWPILEAMGLSLNYHPIFIELILYLLFNSPRMEMDKSEYEKQLELHTQQQEAIRL
jgi:hypothetical protein